MNTAFGQRVLAAVVAGALVCSVPALAVTSWNFDFGSINYGGADGGAAGLTLNAGDWVQVTGDVTTNGLTLDLGRGSGGTKDTVVDWGAVQIEASTNIFTGLTLAGLYTDAMGGARNQGNAGILGVRISGLTAGVYDIYATLGLESPADVTAATGVAFLGTGSSAVATTGAVLNAVSRPWSGFATNDTTLVSGQTWWNYIHAQLTITGTNDYVVLISSLPFASGKQADIEPLISTLQIVAIPEPSSLLLAGVGLLLFARLRRKPQA